MIRAGHQRVVEVRFGRTGLPHIGDDDVLCGYPYGRSGRPKAGTVDPDPARALRLALLPALQRTPCVVAFSGGRDSSLLLAVACELAVREGLDLPVALTFRYPGDPAANEAHWQESVMAHLQSHGLRPYWTCQEVGVEMDLIGAPTARVLRDHGGPTFPPALGSTILLTEAARGGALVTGNFGDEVLGGHRATVLRTVFRSRGRGLTGEDRFRTLLAAAPTPLRRAMLRRRVDEPAWLRPPLRDKVKQRLLDDLAQRPLQWHESVRAALLPRAVLLGRLTRDRIAADHNCLLVEPLGATEFVESYARYGGRFGAISRGDGTRMLAAGLVPEEVVRRGEKAYFNASRFGPVTRRFVRSWDGSGIDDRLIDTSVLRRVWSSEAPPAASAMLLQRAWLAQDEGRP